MHSLEELYRIGPGPSASHTMGPRRAASQYLARHPDAQNFTATLYASLALTGKGHLTDRALMDVFEGRNLEIIWKPDEELPFHPNGMEFCCVENGREQLAWRIYSTGGGALEEEGKEGSVLPDPYPLQTFEEILNWADENGSDLWRYVETCEGEGIWDFLADVWKQMQAAIQHGLDKDGFLPGPLGVQRKGMKSYQRALGQSEYLRRSGLLYAYTLAVSEENASGGTVVTAPTCGACGVVPGVLKALQNRHSLPDKLILRALATAGLVGNLAKTNASISGAEVGCQGEVGVACAMAAAASAQLLGGEPLQIEYAAEMGIEHHLGLTCDPVEGLVQIPCIERNAIAATRAVDCSEYALLSDGVHKISFDEVVETMKQTGLDMHSSYRETSQGGLALTHAKGRKDHFNYCG